MEIYLIAVLAIVWVLGWQAYCLMITMYRLKSLSRPDAAIALIVWPFVVLVATFRHRRKANASG